MLELVVLELVVTVFVLTMLELLEVVPLLEVEELADGVLRAE